jgi:hypothetical protein
MNLTHLLFFQFWAGGTATAATVPTVPGMEFQAKAAVMHWQDTASKMHWQDKETE